MKRSIFTGILVCCAFLSKAQGYSISSRDTIGEFLLNTLHISDKRIANPSFRFNLDSCVLRKYAASHLGDLLSKQGFILVNQYGAEGSVNAARIAGMPADYVTVEWNGVKLNSPSLGMADLSLIPGFFIDDVQISDRPKSAGQHALALGNNLNISSQVSTENDVRILQRISSLNNSFSALSLSRKLSKSHFNIRGFYQNSLNNFKYQDLLQINSPWFWQKHNNVNASGIALNWKRPGQKRIWEANIFGVQRQMNLPSPMGGLSELLSSQFDQQVRASFRSLGKMKEIGRNRVAIFNWSLGSTLESQLYSAPTELSKINTQSNVLTGIYVNKGELVQAQTAVTYQNDFIEYANWDSKLFLNTVQLNQQLSLLKKNNLLLISITPQWRNTNHKGLSTELQWSNRRSDLQHEITIFHRERFPDSNELFWQPGGNVNLKKEASSGVIWAEEFNFQSLNFHSYFKSGIIQNWIQWVPGTLGYWNPQNVKQVVFAQWRAVLKKSWSNIVVQCYGEPALSLGKNLKEQDWFQTTYSPLWRAGIVAQYKGNTWNAQLEFQTNGKRYTDEENTEVYALPAYGLLNSEVSKEVVWKGQSMLCLIRVENITNKQYSFIRAYAMPGRVLSFQINYHIK